MNFSINCPILVISAHADDAEINCVPFIDHKMNQFTVFNIGSTKQNSLQSKGDLGIEGDWQYGNVLYGDYSKTRDIVGQLKSFTNSLKNDMIILTHHPSESHTDHKYTSDIATAISREKNIKGLIYWSSFHEKRNIPFNLRVRATKDQRDRVISSLLNNYNQVLNFDYDIREERWVAKKTITTQLMVEALPTEFKYYIEFLEG